MIKFILFCLIVFIAMVSGARAQDDLGRDPFIFGNRHGKSSPENSSEGNIVTLIIVSDHLKLAIIGGRGYRVGDKIGDGQITAITLYKVTARIGGAIKVYRLAKSSLGKEPKQ